LLSTIDRRLAVDPSRSADWRVRAEIHARKQEWNQAADDMRQYLLLKPHPVWVMLDGVVDFGLFPEHRDHVSAYALFPIYSLDDQAGRHPAGD
jgi:hypothetical protein